MVLLKSFAIPIVSWIILFTTTVKAVDDRGREIVADSSGYVEIKKVKLYYEIYGKGTPLLYLHGGLSSSRDFNKYIPEFSKQFQVVVFDRKGHGRSYDNDEPYNYSSMSEYAYIFLEKMKISKAYVIGWSDGGVVGLHLASKYPSKVIKLLAFGANYSLQGMTESSLEWMRTQLNVDSLSRILPSIGEEYKKINPDPGNFKHFIAQTQEMWLRDPYISKEDFIKIDVPVLLVAGDREDIRLEHMVDMHSLLKKSQLCILPNTTHFIFSEYNEIVSKIIVKFLGK